jgi:hypothetical protein
MATLLEALHARLHSFFQAEPHERLRVNIYSNEPNFRQAVARFDADRQTLTGTATDASMALAVPEQSVTSLSCSVEGYGGTFTAGIVVGFQSYNRFKLIEVSSDGSVWIYTDAGSKWITDPQGPAAHVREPRTFTLEARKQGAWVKVLINGTLLATLNVPEQSNCGLAVTEGTASFHCIRAQ